MSNKPGIGGKNFFQLNPEVVGETVFFDRSECKDLGMRMHDSYIGNAPYPHIAIDDFLPTDLLRRVVDAFPTREPPRFDDTHSKLKTGYRTEGIKSPVITNLLGALNSSQFIEFLEEMTGIRGLIPDPHFAGGGIHETARGGHLSIHADFNLQQRLNLRRRLNLILFLNEEWAEDYGGHLELWSTDMKECRVRINPVMARAVVFNTEEDSYHGHPDPTTSPEHIFRRSIALYYYTAVDTGSKLQPRTTQFKQRPGSGDKAQPMMTRLREIARDLTPPILARGVSRQR